ncbi:condensation domain-containing protein [Micromonospora sp. NPDC048868]|uniref:condensation domain-containing protein n=1 Tax=Micromonospora sp. NPDC048868 TaxID=3364258 RepID=UPI003711DF4D
MTTDPDARRALLVTLLRQRRRADPLPLTATQEGIWLAEQLDPGDSGYHDSIVLRIDGPLDVDALRAGLRDAQARHEALRARFATVDGTPVQHFDVDAPAWAYDELPGYEVDDVRIRRLFALDAATPFDMACGPLWRTRLVRTHARVHLLSIVLHHLITDGASHSVLLGTLMDAYERRRRGDTMAREEHQGAYGRWLRAKVAREAELAGGAAADEVVARLTGLPRRWDLPGVRSAAGRLAVSEPVGVDPDTWRGFLDACRSLGATGFMALGGLLGQLVADECGARDVVVAAPVANRLDRSDRDLIGCLIDVVPIRMTIGPGREVREAIRLGRDAVLAALRSAGVPYRHVARAVGAPASADDPLTNIGLEEFNVSTSARHAGELLITPLPRQGLRLRHDLALSVPVTASAMPELWAPARRWAPGRLAELAGAMAEAVHGVVARR